MLEQKQIKATHPGYQEYIYRWDYYARSYMGAEEYRDGAYLRKYINEDDAPGQQYQQRLLDTAYQNHVKTVVDTYRSFLFRNPPTRTLGRLTDDEFVRKFIRDCDVNGTSLDHFMREVSDIVSIYGGAWVAIDRPAYQAASAAEEQALSIRAYATKYTPTNVLDWRYSKQVNGRKELTYIKVIDEQHQGYDVIRVWTPETIEVYTVAKEEIQKTSNSLMLGNMNYASDVPTREYGEILDYAEYPNPLGEVPFIFIQGDRSFHDGIGTSDIGDVADLSRSIYNKLSELAQNIRISSHPSIVAEPSAELNGGVGAVITIDENTQIQPYLLQPTGASIDGIIKAIELDMEAIDSTTHLKAVKATSGSPMSGVALQTTRQNLNNKLGDRASTLEQAEERMWRLWFMWQGIEPDAEFDVYYEKSFDLRDRHSDLELYRKAIETVPHDAFVHAMHREVASMMIEDENELQDVLDAIAQDHANMNIQVPGEN